MALALLAMLVSALSLTACTAGDIPFVDEDEPEGVAPSPRERSQLAPALQRLLADRARAIRRDRQRAFERTLAGGDEGALVTEERLFHNFTTLPLAGFGYRVDPRGIRRRGDVVTARVWRSVRLEGYDQAAVRTLDRVRFVKAPGSRRGWLVRSGTDEQWRSKREIPLQPWDLERIEVREADGVLLILDRDSLGDAPALLDAVQSGVVDVAPRVPYPWEESVVVYALSDSRFLRGLGDVPGGDPQELDAVTFPVRADGVTGTLVATRFVLAPRMLRRSEDVRDRLIRHELVHVALGVRDDLVPVWLSEGLAEWVSAAGLPEEERTIAGTAVESAVDGVDGMPSDDTFNGPASGANYGLAWFACDYVADAYGEESLWGLLDAMREAGTESASEAPPAAARLDRDQADEVLRDRLGIGEDELADAAARRIVSTFG